MFFAVTAINASFGPLSKLSFTLHCPSCVLRYKQSYKIRPIQKQGATAHTITRDCIFFSTKNSARAASTPSPQTAFSFPRQTQQEQIAHHHHRLHFLFHDKLSKSR
jgi:hypothetical protein